MSRLTISADGTGFERNGEPFFWVGDTVWSAFTNPTIEEWKEYLEYRKAQGFNVIQINTLPQWDRMKPDLGYSMYPAREDDSLIYDEEVSQEYVSRAEEICQMAVDNGFQLALVVAWGNIIPGTWINHVKPSHIWPLEIVKRHVKQVVDIFDKYDPVYFVSGDVNLDQEETVLYYKRVIEALKELAPASLRTMHIMGMYTDIPEELAKDLDFYIYQTGHLKVAQPKIEEITQEMSKKYPGKPLLNAEPCYEGIGKMEEGLGNTPTENYNAEDVYNASKRSILAGAKAGITYGAQGLWNWNRITSVDGIKDPIYGKTLFWRDALHLPGAWKIAELKKLVAK